MAVALHLRTSLIGKLIKLNLWNDSLVGEIPSKWEKHGDCIIFSPKAFTSEVWNNIEIFKTVACILKAKKLARKSGPVQNEGFRRPKVELLFGDGSVVHKKENGIHYAWDITKCMFSSGNITEKQRIAAWDCSGQVVVDLYTGIGYFALNYLVHAKAKLVYACEWNPDAIEALEKNLKLNNVQDKCIILPGDNQITCPKNVADHVNLGLIPSSEASWPVACAALKAGTGGVLHIHGNVDTILAKEDKAEFNSNNNLYELPGSIHSTKIIPKAWREWSNYVQKRIRESIKSLYDNEEWEVSIVDIFKIKSYGPHIDHLVLDIKCNPSPIVHMHMNQ